MAATVDVLICYSHKDETLRSVLETHLAPLTNEGIISAWHDRRIGAGENWRDKIDERLKTAHVVLLLISASFLASNYCFNVEMKRALERHDAGEALVIPIILRDCDWRTAAFEKLLALPKDAKPVMNWNHKDKAWADIARGIRAAVEKLGKATGVASPP